MRLKNKVAIITGAGRGIGKAVALAFAKEGAAIVAVGRTLSLIEATADEVKALGRRALAVSADIPKWDDVERMAKVAAQEFGGIDILINNAGLADIKPKPFFQVTEREWDEGFSVNLKGMFLCCKAVFPFLKERGKGKIVNIGSGTHFLGAPGMIHYASTKGAIIGMTRTLSRELGDHKINVNCVAPGFTITEGIAALMSTPGLDGWPWAGGPSKAAATAGGPHRSHHLSGLGPGRFHNRQTLVVDGGVALH